MHILPCDRVRDDLAAYHDGELPMEERVLIQSHLKECVACRLEAASLAELSDVLRTMSGAVPGRRDGDSGRISSAVLERLRVEPKREAWLRSPKLRVDLLEGGREALEVVPIGGVADVDVDRYQRRAVGDGRQATDQHVADLVAAEQTDDLLRPEVSGGHGRSRWFARCALRSGTPAVGVQHLPPGRLALRQCARGRRE